MSESYIGLAPSYGVFEKQVISSFDKLDASSTPQTYTKYALDFDVVQSTQILVSLDGMSKNQTILIQWVEMHLEICNYLLLMIWVEVMIMVEVKQSQVQL